MRFHFNSEKYKRINSSRIAFYKISLIVGLVSFALLVWMGILDESGMADNAFVETVLMLSIFGTLFAVAVFADYCSFSGERNRIVSSKLFVENEQLHYHQKYNTGRRRNIVITKQYVFKKISDYRVSEKYIYISGEIEYTKNGFCNKPRFISGINIPNFFSPEEKLSNFLSGSKSSK